MPKNYRKSLRETTCTRLKSFRKREKRRSAGTNLQDFLDPFRPYSLFATVLWFDHVTSAGGIPKTGRQPIRQQTDRGTECFRNFWKRMMSISLPRITTRRKLASWNDSTELWKSISRNKLTWFPRSFSSVVFSLPSSDSTKWLLPGASLYFGALYDYTIRP
jgi:hypothetical protein